MKRKQRLFEISYILLLKTFLLGALLAEFFILLIVIGNVFVDEAIINTQENWIWIVGMSYSFMVVVYLTDEKFLERTETLSRSKRFDLMVVFLSGFIFMYMFSNLSIEYIKTWTKSLVWLQLLILVLLPIIFSISLMLRKIQLECSFEKEANKSYFMSDKACETKNDDMFGVISQAERFAERVFNQGSPESLVFGIDAPWGTGKSTFVNLCKEYWQEHYRDQIIVYSFDPLRFENKDNLLNKFIEGLIKMIGSKVFAPEIGTLVSKYVEQLINSKPSISFLGIKFSLPINETIDSVLERLEIALINVDKKIVIIVDDLDRLEFSAIAKVLFVIKKSFALPNISYVLCYDTENIATFSHQNIDKEKVNEFLEKFVNVKTSLYLDSQLLLEYFTSNKDKSLANNLFANPELISKAVEGLKDIFNSKDFHSYLSFIGDARKLKRLINTILLLEVQETDFDNNDFDKQDLIHLLLIYIHYPNVFRKIYNAETQGKKGFFSVVHNENKYKNTDEYDKYLATLTDNQKFILDKVFKRLNGNKPTEEMLASYACFNGFEWTRNNRNLEQYLNLITKMSKPLQTDQYQFYINHKKMILTNKPIGEIFNKSQFLMSEPNQKQLWKTLVNSSNKEFTPDKSVEIIDYALKILPECSNIKNSDIIDNLRDTLIFYIIKLLDKVSWADEQGRFINNTDENIIQIAKWIFGEDKYKGKGILNILSSKERGVLGLYDLILFRLRCCADRGGDVFNLSRALSKYDNPNAPTEGSTQIIVIDEMRKMSQKVFHIFKAQFIDSKKNIFNEIDNVTIETASGRYFDLIKSETSSQTLEEELLRIKSRMKLFITYQLGNSMISNGIGCGYYDSIGNKDEKKISGLINEYLFNYCFNPQIQLNNYKHFINYLLLNFSNSIPFRDTYQPNINDFTKVLEKNQLISYWKKNGHAIKSHKFENTSVKIYTSNGTVSYSEHLVKIYALLDEITSSKQNYIKRFRHGKLKLKNKGNVMEKNKDK